MQEDTSPNTPPIENSSDGNIQVDHPHKWSFFRKVCNSYTGKERRNVPKYIARKLLKFVKDNRDDVRREIDQKIDISQEDFERIYQKFLNIYEQEKIRNSDTRYKKDYVKMIDTIIISFPCLIILNVSLKRSLTNLSNGKCGRIKGDNIKIYKSAMESIYHEGCNQERIRHEISQ